jgi:hypothetical protein
MNNKKLNHVRFKKFARVKTSTQWKAVNNGEIAGIAMDNRGLYVAIADSLGQIRFELSDWNSITKPKFVEDLTRCLQNVQQIFIDAWAVNQQNATVKTLLAALMALPNKKSPCRVSLSVEPPPSLMQERNTGYSRSVAALRYGFNTMQTLKAKTIEKEYESEWRLLREGSQ